jgi:hypothetical protein
MDPTGLLDSILAGSARIDRGRKGFATDGEEHQGRLNYENGIATAGAAFTEAQASADPQTMMLAEEAFVEQELQFCSEQDTHTQSSLKAALRSFDDAFLSLEAVEDAAGYKVADKTWPHNQKNRIQDFPKDAFHQTCIAHRTRLNNVLRAPGINMIEKAVLQQRAANMTAAQNSYIQKQKTALKGAGRIPRM